MRVNPRVFTERIDMLDGIRIPNCPSTSICGFSLRSVCENIMNMAIKLGVSFTGYHTVTELDNMLAIAYWQEYDGMKELDKISSSFDNWFIHVATAWEAIRRSREWLAQHNYIFVEPDVQQRAYEAGAKFSKAIKQ